MLPAVTSFRGLTATTLKYSLHERRLFPKADVLYIRVYLHEQGFL